MRRREEFWRSRFVRNCEGCGDIERRQTGLGQRSCSQPCVFIDCLVRCALRICHPSLYGVHCCREAGGNGPTPHPRPNYHIYTAQVAPSDTHGDNLYPFVLRFRSPIPT